MENFFFVQRWWIKNYSTWSKKARWCSKNDIINSTEYDKFDKNVNATQTTDTSDLLKKTNWNKKTNERENKFIDRDYGNYITNQESNKPTADTFTVRLKLTNSASKSYIADFLKRLILMKIFKK